MDSISAPSWQFKPPSYAAGAGAEAAAAEYSSPAAPRGTPAVLSPLRINVRAYGMVLVGLALVFAWLWLSAGTSSGTWWRGVWYSAALVQAVVAAMLLCAAGGQTRRRWGPPLGTTLLPLAAPLVYVVLLEIYLADPDAGDAQKHWALWAGRVVAVLSLLSAGAAAGLYWRARKG
jgi:hypothetical protein